MKHIQTYEKFTTEKFNLKKALVGGAIGGLIGTGLYHSSQIYKNAELVDTEIVAGQKFNQYSVIVNGETFELNISDDGVISSSWSESHGSGKNRTTETYNCVTVPKGTTEIWIDTKFFELNNSIFVSTKPLSGGQKIELSKLDIEEKTNTYTVYSGSFFSSIDYIIVDNGHTLGEEFVIQNKMGNWVCDKIGTHIYIFTLKDFGGGKTGGAGSTSKY